MHIELLQKLFNCDDVKWALTKTEKLVMGFWYEDVESKDERKNWKDQQKPQEQTPLKNAATLFMGDYGKNHCRINELNLLNKNSFGKYS